MNKSTTAKQLASDLRRTAAQATEAASAVVKRGAADIKDQARASVAASGHPEAQRAARAISFDMISPIDARIGYYASVESIAAQIEHGGAAAGPGGHLSRALKIEQPDFERILPLAVLKRMDS